uniref:phage minor capsid protein n=1 Tax=Agathobacter sp. TaxID=2021311 RepID=UPI00402731DB
MLEPEYFYGKSDKMVEMYQELEDWILRDIASRLLKSGDLSGTADRELWKLEQMGLHRQEIIKRLSQLTGKSRNEIRRLLQDSAMTSFSNDSEVLEKVAQVVPLLQNNDVIQALNAELTKTMGELGNLTRTTMMQSQRDLLNMLNEVDFRVASGLQSYSSAVCEVLDRYAESGVMVNYPTGSRRSLEAAVRCCIVTSMNQTAAEVTNQYIIQHGVEYVVVSQHLGARYNPKDPTGVSSHDWWQGKTYKIHGSEPGFPNLLESTGYNIDFESKRGVCVNMLGLHGYNCRHSHGPWYKELGDRAFPKLDKEESQKRYDLEQKQRYFERAVRKTKRLLLVKEQELKAFPDNQDIQSEYDKLSYKLRMQNRQYGEFCAENDLQRQYDRVKVAGFKKEQAKRANGRATAYSNYASKYNGVPNAWMKTKGQKIDPNIKVINPNFSNENCASGVVAYEMRQRGLNIVAKDKGILELMQEPWKAWENVEPIEGLSKHDIIELIKAEHGNCRYELAFEHKYGAHCVVVEKYDKTISIVDPQTGDRYNANEYKVEMNNILFWKISDAEVSKDGVRGCRTMN